MYGKSLAVAKKYVVKWSLPNTKKLVDKGTKGD
jgi:hypothetical protein